MNALILSGGVAHDYAGTSAILASVLRGSHASVHVTEDLEILSSPQARNFDIIVINCVRWTCRQTPEWYDRWHYSMPTANRAGLVAHLASGKGLLALHAATICFDDWAEYSQILGAWWEWGVSGHAPYQEHLMRIRRPHRIVDGVSEFRIVDELYTHPRLVEDIDPLMTASWGGEEHPMLWVRRYLAGRVCYCALGHGVESMQDPTLQKLLTRCALWVEGRLPSCGPE